MPRVFIGIPTFNRSQFVQAAIDSVRAQTFADWTLIVSDNASRPEVRAQVAAIVEAIDDDRVHHHQQSENGGEYGQGRFFHDRATRCGAEFLVILHDDDLMQPDFLERAVQALTQRPELAFFACNPDVIDADGRSSADGTAQFMRQWQREGVPRGEIDVLTTHMQCGFTPISGAFFRMSALSESGYVDPDLGGCFPFESNIFVRLGEIGARAWFEPDALLAFRRHDGQMTHWNFLQNDEVVDATITLYERRRFDGANEQRRRLLLGRLYRIRALARARSGAAAAARRDILQALAMNPRSPKTWLLLPPTALLSGLLHLFWHRPATPPVAAPAAPSRQEEWTS